MSRRNRKPLPEGLFDAEVERLSPEGRGVAHVEGKVLFLDGGLPGEAVRFRYLTRRRHYDEGVVEEVLRPAPERVPPRCPHFGVCGGCVLQHLAPEAQLRHKEAALLESLERLGGVAPEAVFPPVAGPVWGYRRRARLAARWVPRKGGALVGFRERRSSYVADITTCPILEPSVGERIPALRELVGSLEARERLPQIEVAVGEGEGGPDTAPDTVLVFRHLDPLSEADRERLRAFGAAEGIRVFLQGAGPDSVHPLDPPTDPDGEGLLRYAHPAFGVTLRFAPTDFVQVNAAVNRALVERAVALLDPRPGERVLDLYCGLGNFSLPLARRGAAVTGVEGVPALVERARDNARRNGLEADFHVADLDDGAAPWPWAAGGWDKLLIDPPRTGAAAVAARIRELDPGRIVYVSCNHATLARDAGELVRRHGYRLRGAGVVDMFPHTAHAECIALFER